MTRYVLAIALATGMLGREAVAKERNYTIRGFGYFNASGRDGRREMNEVRMTFRDNGYFAVTLFTRGERHLVRGQWDRRTGNIERIEIEDAFGQRAQGRGSVVFRRDGDDAPERLELEGRTARGPFRAVIDDDRVPRRNDDWGRGNRLPRSIDASSDGVGLLRMSAVRDGRFHRVRARLGEGREARIEIDRPTRGTIRGEIQDVSGDRVLVRVSEILGHRASGELVVVLRGRDDVARINGSGTGSQGSWQLDFDPRGVPNDDDWSPDWGRGFESTERGSGQLRQDIGPAIPFDRMRVSLQNDRDAVIVLDGRRDPVRFVGRWSATRDGDVRIEITQVNEMRASGRLELRRVGNSIRSLNGSGRTDRGRFEVVFH